MGTGQEKAEEGGQVRGAGEMVSWGRTRCVRV